MDKRHHHLIFGGPSSERRVSTASAQGLLATYPFAKIFFVEMDESIVEVSKAELENFQEPFKRDFFAEHPMATWPGTLTGWREFLQSHQGATFFFAFHGQFGEDGQVQSRFIENKVSFTGSGPQASQLCFDKNKAKLKLAANTHIRTAEQIVLGAEQSLAQWQQAAETFLRQHQRAVLKPNASGSSDRLFFIETPSELAPILQQLDGQRTDYLLEQWIAGRELTTGVIARANGDLEPLVPSEVLLQAGKKFDFAGKYFGEATEITPADVPEKLRQESCQLALAAHEALGCYGYSRTDMIVTATGEIYFLEINTLPGLTKASFLPAQLQARQIKFQDFIAEQMLLAQRRGGR